MTSMPTSGTGTSTKLSRHIQAAFSLLELMVVVAIIGLVAGTLVLSMQLGSSERALEREVDRLRGLVQLLREEALMQNRDYGLEMSEAGYRFFVYDYAQLAWFPPPNEQLFVEHLLPDPMGLELLLEDRDVTLDLEFEESIEDDVEREPQILVLSTGELTPFEVGIFRDRTGGRTVLTAAIDGSLEVSSRGFQ